MERVLRGAMETLPRIPLDGGHLLLDAGTGKRYRLEDLTLDTEAGLIHRGVGST